jgi:hypothetical protein
MQLNYKFQLLWLLVISNPLLGGFACASDMATSAQMQGAINQGKVLGHYLGSANPMQQANGTSTSFTATPYGGAPDTGPSGYVSNGDYKVTFNCKTKTPIYAAGNTINIGDCVTQNTGSGSQVKSLNLSVCTKSNSGGVCGPTDFSPYTTVYTGQATILTPSTVGALVSTCSADNSLTCTGDLVLRSTLTVSGSQLASRGSTAAQSSVAQQMVASTYNNGAYQAEVQSAGPGLNTCYQGQVQSGLESDGVVHTCDGQQSVTFAAATCPPPVSQCVQYATQSNNWTTSCNADVPIAVQSCTSVTPTKDCPVTMTQATYNCTKTLDLVVTTNAGCTPGQFLARVTADPCPSCSDYLVYDFSCASATTYNMHFYTDWHGTTSVYQDVAYVSVNAAAGTSVGRTRAWTGQYAYVDYSQTCTDLSCVLATWFANPSQGTSSYGSSTFIAPLQYTTAESWNDSCAAYEAAQ